MKKKKGFTLIELIAVLVILAILALIVTPLIMNIIKKAKDSASKRSIDAYGRAVELAVVSYLLDNGDFPKDVSDLSIEYTGDRVECETVQLKSDSTVYLSGCSVGGVSVDGYSYGKEEITYTSYNVGDTVEYNNVQYGVIKNSSASDANVTLIRLEQLTASEITTYSAATGVDTYDLDSIEYSASNSDYSTSYVKVVVDAWAAEIAPDAIEARLITLDELTQNLGYEKGMINPTAQGYLPTSSTPSWFYGPNLYFWTMSAYNDSENLVVIVGKDGNAGYSDIVDGDVCVRPVITVPKSLIN